MAIELLFPEGPQLRRLASTLAMPRSGGRGDLAMSSPAFAYFLSFPWDGRPVRRRRALDMRTMSVGSWFEAVPWTGLAALEVSRGAPMDEEETREFEPPNAGPVQEPATEGEVSSFFDCMFDD